MPPEQNGPVAGGTASRAGYQDAEQHFDTANHSLAQPAEQACSGACGKAEG
jgi:hypothetical protein